MHRVVAAIKTKKTLSEILQTSFREIPTIEDGI